MQQFKVVFIVLGAILAIPVNTYGQVDPGDIIYADLILTANLDTFQYRYASGTLYRTVNSIDEFPIAQYLTDSTSFYYYDLNEVAVTENPITTLNSIWSIRLKLVESKGTRDMILQSHTFPQNLKYGNVL